MLNCGVVPSTLVILPRGSSALIPIGIYLGKRKIREGLAEKTFDRKTALRRVAWFFGTTTLLNILIGTQVTYRAVKHMETPQFCGAMSHHEP